MRIVYLVRNIVFLTDTFWFCDIKCGGLESVMPRMGLCVIQDICGSDYPGLHFGVESKNNK